MALAIGSGAGTPVRFIYRSCCGDCHCSDGGSRFSVSGPTAAFVVILYPVSQQFGLAGLLVATLLSGFFSILMGLARFGRLMSIFRFPSPSRFHLGYRDHHRYHAD
ncbi:hypothetical protein ACVXHA_27975 [Escherichia coli]